MELSELSSTQPSAQQGRILVNAQGIPLKINLQAVELEGRPKLVRLLKSSGALVVSNAKEAAIILVDSTTESGKRLIRTWGHDASKGKVVLEHTWARVSIHAGRPLLEADNWGGAMTVDDGKPVTIDGVVVDEDELEEVEALVTKSPLPTPRVTPVDATSQRPANTVANHSDITRSEPNMSAPRAMGLPPPGPPIAQPAVVGATLSEEPVTDIHDDIPPAQTPQHQPATQPLPYHQPTLFVQPSDLQNTYAYAPFATQQAYPSSQPQVMPTQPFLHTGFPSSQPQIVHAPSVPHTTLPSIQAQVMQMTPNTTSINGVNVQNPNLATIMTIMEVVRHMDQSSWFGQNQLPVSQPPANSNTSTFSVQSPPTPGPTPSTSIPRATRVFESPSVDTSQDHLSDTATSSRKRRSGTEDSEDRSVTRNIKSFRRPPDEMLTPSISRERPPAVKHTNPPPKRLRQGKGKAISTDSSEHSEADELMGASEGSYSTHSSVPSVQPRKIIARKKHGDIFLSGSGQSLRFFVQVDLHGRHTVVTTIKKNKGKIVNNIADADYLILSARSDTFQGLLNEAIALGKSPILAAFVADCVEEGALLDETDYVMESVTKVKPLKRGRQGAFSIKVETPETLTHQIKVTMPKSSPAAGEGKKMRGTPSKSSTNKKSKKAPNSAPSKPVAEEVGDSTTSRSPTPPPAVTRQLMKNGKYLFTEAEDEYFLRLAKHHLTRDPTISNTALIHKLHKKMPHHTTASWVAHIEKKVKGALDDVRKRANIANRKRANEAVYQNSSREFNSDSMPSKWCILATAQENGGVSLNPSHPSQEDLERQDFDVITQFFASGGGDDDDDERVWQELEKHQRCRSASSWPDYYAAHEKQVYARIEELMNGRAGD